MENSGFLIEAQTAMLHDNINLEGADLAIFLDRPWLERKLRKRGYAELRKSLESELRSRIEQHAFYWVNWKIIEHPHRATRGACVLDMGLNLKRHLHVCQYEKFGEEVKSWCDHILRARNLGASHIVVSR